MLRILVRAALFLMAAALGLVVAASLLDRFHVHLGGFVTAVVVYAVAQSVLAPFVFNLARKHVPALLGGIGIVSTLVALIVASFVSDGLSINGMGTWILGALVVWVVTALGSVLLPVLVFKKFLANRSGEPSMRLSER